MACKTKRRSLRCGGRPKAGFGSLFTSVIAPALNATGSIVDESINNNKTATNGVVNGNTTIPSDPTKTPTMILGGRKKCWIGAAIGAATSIAGSLFGNSAQKREMRRKKSIQDWQTATQEAAAMSSALNNSQDYQEDYLRQFRTAARLGKTLGAKGIYITDGGDATKIGNNTYLLRGGSHEDVNETGQTGIGINVGGNEVEAEGGEVAQKKNGALRIFSAQPILGNGMSPAQAILRGYNKDSVFKQQQAFKKRNGLKDDGSRLRNGGLTSKDRGSSKHSYPSVASKDFAGSGRSYPIPTKADAVDALRLAGLHGRSDVKVKVYSRYPELRKKAKGGAKIEPYYDWARNTSSNLGISFIDPTYDYRAYYNSVTPYERALIRFAPQGTHFTDIGKTPKHPTFSNESKYSNDKTPGGTWNGNVFVPNVWQFGNNGNSRRNKYMNNSDEGYFNGRVNVFPISRKRNSLGCRTKLRNGGWKAPIYNTKKYRVSNRMRQQIATWEGSDFAGQNRKFNGDAIGAKERELRQFMGKAYNYLNDNQRDALLSYYYNLVPKTFKNQMTKYRNALINAQTEQEYNDTLNNMRESINVGANRKGMRGLRNRRAIERNWFGYNYSNPIQEKVDKTLTQVPDATKVVQPIIQQPAIIKPIEINSQEGYVPNDNPQGYNIPQGRLYDFIKGSMKRQLRCGGSSRPVKGIRPKAELGWLGYPYPLPRKWDFTNINLGNYKPSVLSKNYPYGRGMDDKARQLESSDNYRDFSLYRTQLDETNPYIQALTKATGHNWSDIKDNNYKLRYDNKLGYNHFTPEVKEDKYGIWGEPVEQKTWLDDNKIDVKIPYAPNENINTNKSIPVNTKKTIEYDIRDNKFGMTPSTGDWIGLGVDTLAGLAGGIINYNAAKDIYSPGRAPIMLASKLPTNYNITPQLEEVKRYRDRLTGETYANTSSSVAALNRARNINLNSLNELSKLWTTKENEENKMLTQDALNQQSVAETNIRNQMARESEIAKYKNAQNQAKYDAINTSLTGLAQAYNNFYTNATKRYEDEIAMRTYLAGSEAATPYRMLSMGVPMSTRSRIGLLNQVGSITNPGPRPERKDYDSNASWSRAIDKWEKNNTLYKQRGQYKNMILRGISSKAKRKYGIG